MDTFPNPSLCFFLPIDPACFCSTAAVADQLAVTFSQAGDACVQALSLSARLPHQSQQELQLLPCAAHTSVTSSCGRAAMHSWVSSCIPVFQSHAPHSDSRVCPPPHSRQLQHARHGSVAPLHCMPVSTSTCDDGNAMSSNFVHDKPMCMGSVQGLQHQPESSSQRSVVASGTRVSGAGSAGPPQITCSSTQSDTLSDPSCACHLWPSCYSAVGILLQPCTHYPAANARVSACARATSTGCALCH